MNLSFGFNFGFQFQLGMSMAEYGRVGSAADEMKYQEEREARRGGAVFPKGELYVPRDEPVDVNAASPEIGVEFASTDEINLEPSAVRLKINILYNPMEQFNPFRYELLFPDELSRFFYEAGLTNSEHGTYTGSSIGYRLAAEAKRRGEQEAQEIARRYKKYFEDKKQAHSYTHTVTL